jgi:hypothetical protein
MTGRAFVAYVLLVVPVANTACATRYGPHGPVLEPARQAEAVRKQAETLGRGTRVVVTLIDLRKVTGILQDVSAQSLAVQTHTRTPVQSQVIQLRDIAWIEKQRMATWKKSLMWVGIGCGIGFAALAVMVAAACSGGC